MSQIGSMAGSAHDVAVRHLADELRRVATEATSTTTSLPRSVSKSQSKSKVGKGFTFSAGLNETLYYGGLKHACSQVSSSQ